MSSQRAAHTLFQKAPELAQVDVALFTLTVLERIILSVHGEHDFDPLPDDAPTVARAVDVLGHLRALRRSLHRYRAAVQRVLRPCAKGCQEDRTL